MRKAKGFTLMEMLIVIAIIAILIAIAIPVFTSQLENAKRGTDEANARSAYGAALAAYMSDGATGDVSYVFDAGSGDVLSGVGPSGVAGYGQWDKPADYEVGGIAVTGIANDGSAHAVTVRVTNGEVSSVRWGGNDLTTSAGRRQEDIDNMHSISKALTKAFEAGNLHFQKNYIQVAVFADGTMAYFNDSYGGTQDLETIKTALQDAGLPTDTTSLHSTDAKWKNGYLVHIEKNGSVTYKALSASDNNESHTIGSGWWYKQNLDDEDLVN